MLDIKYEVNFGNIFICTIQVVRQRFQKYTNIFYHMLPINIIFSPPSQNVVTFSFEFEQITTFSEYSSSETKIQKMHKIYVLPCVTPKHFFLLKANDEHLSSQV